MTTRCPKINEIAAQGNRLLGVFEQSGRERIALQLEPVTLKLGAGWLEVAIGELEEYLATDRRA